MGETRLEYLTRDEIRNIDKVTITKYGLPGIALMENAGRGAAQIIAPLIEKDSRIYIVCGKGNNGGDGFVIARHLFNWGFGPEVILTSPQDQLLSSNTDAAVNLKVIIRMGIKLDEADSTDALKRLIPCTSQKDLIVDALFGTGLKGQLREPYFSTVSYTHLTLPTTERV